LENRDTLSDSYQQAEWRLVLSGLQSGPINMACDEAILESVAAGQSPPTLRFYGWHPACMSLGFRQSWRVLDVDYCRSVGWDIVRRPTGGRAILHIDELTYSVCAPIGEPRVKGGVLESYQRLSEAILAGLRELGLEPAKANIDPSIVRNDGPACFDVPSNYEITVHGHKLVGSAQVRKQGVVLQHGTLPLFGDISRIVEALVFESEDQRKELIEQLKRRAITLESSLGRPLPFKEVAGKMRRGFEQALNLSFSEDDVSLREQERTEELIATKYGNDDWTRRL